jgi:hypothetical protein
VSVGHFKKPSYETSWEGKTIITLVEVEDFVLLVLFVDVEDSCYAILV